jgi:hypothetical protein
MNFRILRSLAREMAALISPRTFQRFSVSVFQLLLLYSLSLSIFETASAQSNVLPAPPTNFHVVTKGTVGASPDIPSLNWQPLSDWINVKTSVSPDAIGDGVADDTAAIQAALNMTNVGKTVYLPAGTYKITQTLAMHGPAPGSTIIGNGRDTRIVWGGAAGGTMFWSDGIAYSRYVGLSWDGSNIAAVGFDHASTKTFETEVQHQDESFRNFTSYGIRVGNNQIVASAEILYRNCLFTNCNTGIGLLTMNDYDNTIDHCEFENCNIGVHAPHGNFYARDSHFQNSSQADFVFSSEHGCSVRRCTSTGSAQFISVASSVTTLTVQDCQIANWTTNTEAIYLDSPSAVIFDCAFTNGPTNSFPIGTYASTLFCNNNPSNLATLTRGKMARSIYTIPNGTLTRVLTNANQTFLQETAAVPGKIFDAKVNFGAIGNGITDDTTAIQSTINAAMSYGQGAMAYLPTGSYVVKQTLSVRGTNYIMGGSGFQCGLIWKGATGAPTITVSNVQNVTLVNFCAGGGNFGTMTNGDDIWVTSASNQPCRLTVDGVYVYGRYALNPDVHGIHFDSLPAGSVIVVPVVQGNIRITNCAQATLLFRTSYEGTLTLRGPGSTNNMPGFLFRLATITDPALQVFDNQSVVMSDFYVESSYEIATISGGNGQGPGAITIQHPKSSLEYTTNNPYLAMNDYNGRIFLGEMQFYPQGPGNTVFQSTNSTSLQLILAGGVWYNTQPVFNLDVNTTLTLMGNVGIGTTATTAIPDSGITSQSQINLSLALDDLRRLGQLDYSLSQANP